MNVFFALIILLAVYHAKFRKDGFHEDYISQQRIQPIKGIFTLLIFMSHFIPYVALTEPRNTPYFLFRSWMGQLVVVPFLFYSGYGIAESIRRKGINYVKQMPKNRILKVLFQFDLAILLFLLLRFVKGETYTLPYILLTFIGWNGVGNSNWYIMAILYLYAATWLSFLIFRKGKVLPLLSVTILTGIYVVGLKLFSDKQEYWFNTIMAYAAGMFFSYFREKFEAFALSDKRYGWLLGITIILMHYLHASWDKVLIHQMVSILFAIVMVLVTAKVQIRNQFLSYCGEHLFSLFILQRLPMLALNDTAIEQWPYIYFIICLAVTFLLSIAFDRLTPKLWKAIFE